MSILKSTFVALLTLLSLVSYCDEPFRWSLKQGANELTVSVSVAPGAYFYADSLSIRATGADGKVAQPTSKAAASLFSDEFAGETQVYQPGTYHWEFTGMAPFKATITYQGCKKSTADTPALCMLPQTVELGGETPAEKLEAKAELLPVKLEDFKAVSKLVGVVDEARFKVFLSGKEVSESEKDPLAGRGIWAVIVLTLLGGLLLNLTPCVLPMIPINLAIIGADGSDKITGFRRGMFYGAGMAAAYGILGLCVVLAGAQFGQLNASSWFNFAVAGVFVILALGMFGAFNLDFSRYGGIKSSRIRGGKDVVALVMGAIAALLAGACVAPVVISALVLSAELYQSGYVLALGLPFLLGVGMALPWPFAGAGLAVLPKPGYFMVIVKYVFGAIILLAAVYYAYTGFTLLPGKFSPEAEFVRLESGLAEARSKQKPVLVDFWASWCKNCKSMERNVLSTPAIRAELENYVVVKFQAEDPGAPGIAALLKHWDIAGLPAFVILKAQQ